MLAEIHELDIRREGRLGEGAGRRRDDDLAAVCCSGDPRRTVNVDPDIVVAAGDALAGVKAHPDARRLATRPGRGREGALRRNRGGDSRRRVAEDDEERVALGRSLDPAGRCECGPEEALMLLEQSTVGGRPERLDEACRTLDVAEQECERAGRRRPPRSGHQRHATPRPCGAAIYPTQPGLARPPSGYRCAAPDRYRP